ncbi:MAG: alpha/beta fold hydrolase [Deltaproteobacteria bacterium]|nr:alpha/beta fold hydrolase [Deltaproteobacteria bacterium]
MIDLSRDERARAFAFDRGPIGCLLLHGFTGTPAEMRPLGERLAERGYSVRAPVLPGHATRVEDLAGSRWADWFAAAEESWQELGARAPLRMVAGLSMGALLSLHLAHERPREVRAVAALAPVLELANQRSAAAALWLRRLPLLPRRFEIVAKRGSGPDGGSRLTPAYDEIPLRALASLIELQRTVRSELAEITTPVLILEGGRDQTVAPRAPSMVEAGLASSTKVRIRFARSGHILTEDVEAAAVLDAVERFFAAQAAG